MYCRDRNLNRKIKIIRSASCIFYINAMIRCFLPFLNVAHWDFKVQCLFFWPCFYADGISVFGLLALMDDNGVFTNTADILVFHEEQQKRSDDQTPI